MPGTSRILSGRVGPLPLGCGRPVGTRVGVRKKMSEIGRGGISSSRRRFRGAEDRLRGARRFSTKATRPPTPGHGSAPRPCATSPRRAGVGSGSGTGAPLADPTPRRTTRPPWSWRPRAAWVRRWSASTPGCDRGSTRGRALVRRRGSAEQRERFLRGDLLTHWVVELEAEEIFEGFPVLAGVVVGSALDQDGIRSEASSDGDPDISSFLDPIRRSTAVQEGRVKIENAPRRFWGRVHGTGVYVFAQGCLGTKFSRFLIWPDSLTRPASP